MSHLVKLAIVQGAGYPRSVHRQVGAGKCGAIHGQIVTSVYKTVPIEHLHQAGQFGSQDETCRSVQRAITLSEFSFCISYISNLIKCQASSVH
jgi:hypothetical protein